MVNKTYPFVAIVIPIVGYKNIPSYLLESIISLIYPKNKLEILFVKLISQRVLLPRLGIKTTCINSKKIIGYSQAVNLGVRKSIGELIFLMNPDIRLDRNVLLNLVDEIRFDNYARVVGPVIYQLKNQKEISPYDLPVVNFKRTHGKMNPLSTKYIARLKKPREVDWLSGCALLFPRKIWKELGGFEGKLFIYWEDADFCMRAKEKGMRVVLVPQARVWHEGSAFMRSQSISKMYYLVRNGNYFFHRHTGLLGKVFLHRNNLLLIIIKVVRFVLQPGKRQESYVYLCGVFDFYRGKWGRRVWDERRKLP